MPLVLKDMVWARCSRGQKTSTAPSPCRWKARTVHTKLISKGSRKVQSGSESETPSYTFDLRRVNPGAHNSQKREMAQLMSAAKIVRRNATQAELACFLKQPTKCLRNWLRFHNGDLTAREEGEVREVLSAKENVKQIPATHKDNPSKKTDVRRLVSVCHGETSLWHL